MASGTAAGCVSAITRVASGRPRCAREDFRPATPCDTKRARHATRGGRAWRTLPRAVASPTANTAVSTFRDGEITGDESDEALVKTRVAREAEMASLEFEKIWTSDAAVRGIITGERAANADLNRPPIGTSARVPRRRTGYQPSASDLARDAAEKASAAKKSEAHPSAAAFANPAYREARAKALYPILAAAFVPRDGTVDGTVRFAPYTHEHTIRASLQNGSVTHAKCFAEAMAKIPFALADSSPADAARVLVDLREAHGDNADLVAMLIANPELITARPKPRDDPARAEAKRAERREKRAAAAAAARAATARVGARVLDGSKKKHRSVVAADGREDGAWRVGGTLKGTSTRADDLCVRFWNLWGGSSECRKVVTASARGSVYRDPARVESKVTRLDKFMPFVDAPMLLHRAPRLLELETVALVRAIVRMKHILPGGDIGRILELAPELLLAGDEAFAGAVAGVAAELAEKRNGAPASRRDVYQAAAKLVRDGGAASLLARGETQKAVVVPVTEKANVHFSG